MSAIKTPPHRPLVSSVSLEESPLTPAELVHKPMPVWKRVCDVIGSAFLIVVLSPILALVAIYIRIRAGAPFTFTQSRLGEMAKYFTIFKFRTLANAPEKNLDHRDYISDLLNAGAPLEKPDFGDRLIPGGSFLRAHALDELPQLFNVLFGSMSLVGPRPEVLDWDDYEPGHRRRLEATPGMTGLWQVSGKNKLTFEEMVDLDLKYIENRSFRFDLWILVRTVWVVIKPSE